MNRISLLFPFSFLSVSKNYLVLTIPCIFHFSRLFSQCYMPFLINVLLLFPSSLTGLFLLSLYSYSSFFPSFWLCRFDVFSCLFYNVVNRCHIRMPERFLDSGIQLLGSYLRHSQELKNTDNYWIPSKVNIHILMCIREFCRSGGPSIFSWWIDEFPLSSHHSDLCEYLIQLMREVSFTNELIVFESLIELSQFPECRVRLSHQSELDYFFQRLASSTSTLPAVITLIMILTALVADDSLELPFFSLHIDSTRVLEGGQDPRFIEAFSQFLLVREVRCWIGYMRLWLDHVLPTKEESTVVEHFFLHCTLLPSMHCTRKLLMRQIRCFPSSLKDAAFLSFAAKLDDSLLSLLFNSSESQVLISLSVISMFFCNRMFCITLISRAVLEFHHYSRGAETPCFSSGALFSKWIYTNWSFLID